jgi:hypothetical protein
LRIYGFSQFPTKESFHSNAFTVYSGDRLRTGSFTDNMYIKKADYFQELLLLSTESVTRHLIWLPISKTEIYEGKNDPSGTDYEEL